MKYWLMKSEPEVYGIEHLKRDQKTLWDGVRNYQARNFLRLMEPDDLAFFYHSNTTPPGIIGLMRVIQSGIDDPTQFDPNSPYYDPKSTPAAPRWQTVMVEFVEHFPALLPLDALRATFSADELLLVRQGNRLSVMPVDVSVAQRVLSMVQSNNG